MKFDFNNSRYAQFFNSEGGRQILQSFIDESGLIRINYGWWRDQFAVNPEVTPTAADGTASFTIRARKLDSAPLMDLRAPMGDAHPMDTSGFAVYQGTIPDFISPAIVETAMEREYKERQFEQYGNDADIIRAWSQDVQKLIDSKDQTLNRLGAELQSTGMMNVDFGRGIKAPIQRAEIPDENFVNAGEKVWSAPDCKILSQMAKIEDDFRQRTGYAGQMKWMVDWDMFNNIILKNQEVKDWVKQYREVNAGIAINTDIPIIPETLFRAAIAGFPMLSPIEVVIEKEKDMNFEGERFVHGWKSGIAVLRPVGYAGMIMRTDILDRLLIDKYSNNAISTVFAAIDGGLALLDNSVVPNGRFKEWHTSVKMSAIPALTEFPYHIIVDTTTANT